MSNGLLRRDELAAIEALLNEGRLEEAQHQLASLPEGIGTEQERVYFVTRLLYQRGRLDRQGALERLGELLAENPDFQEARRVLDAAERGEPMPRIPPVATAGEDPNFRQTLPSSRLSGGELGAFPKPPIVPDLKEIGARAPSKPTPFPTEEGSARLPTPLPRVPSLELPAQRAGSSFPPPERTHPHRSTFPSPKTVGADASASRVLLENRFGDGDSESALRTAQPEGKAERDLQTARDFARFGEIERSKKELAELLEAPNLEPNVRAAAARVLIELGSPESALEHARRALSEDPKDPAVRITCAWALLRTGQGGLGPRHTTEIEGLLSALRVKDPSLASLLPALRAWVSFRRGDLTSALGFAQTAVSLDPNQPDALGALALASQRLGLTAEAERARQKLQNVAPEQIRILRDTLQDSELAQRRTEPWRMASEASVTELFGSVEAALRQGKNEPFRVEFEQASSERLRSIRRRGGDDVWPALAAAGARLFTQLPVLRHFAPYDSSVFSIERLSAAFDILYGASNAPWREHAPSLILVGAYCGETLRQAYGGEWQGSPENPGAASMEAIGLSIRPCERVKESLLSRKPLIFDPPAHLHPGADPLGNTAPLALAPPAPWGPEAWPPLGRLSEMGRLLPQSVIGVYCERTGAMLDHSVSSVASIDRYAQLLAPPTAPPALDAGWTRRVAVLVGAYLGEVLIGSARARWVETDQAEGPSAYRIELRDGSQTTPIARALDRFSSRRVSPLSDYVSRVLGGRGTILPPA